MKIALYVRVSTDRQAEEGISLEMQMAKLRAYAALYDHEIVAELTDDGYSAKNLRRPAIQEALQMLSDGRADGLLILKLDRLTRSLEDMTSLIKTHFHEGGCTLLSCYDHIDTSTANGRLFLNLQMSISQWERETIGERTQQALQFKKENGRVYCANVYGWDNVDGHLVPNGGEQHILEQIALRREAGKSFESIAGLLNDGQVPAPRGDKWYPMTVKRVLEKAEELNRVLLTT